MTLFVCFGILEYSALPVCLHGVDFYNKSSIELGGTVFFSALSECFKVAVCSVCMEFLVFGLCMLVVHSLIGSPLQLAY